MITEALECYNFKNPKEKLIRHSENLTYKITDNDKNYLLRIHKPVEGFNMDIVRPGKDANELIAGEIELLLYLAERGNVLTQKVVRNKFGSAVTTLGDNIPVTVLEWIDGETLDNIEITEAIAYEIGVTVGKMHNDMENLTLKNRYHYDELLITKLIGETGAALEQGNFNENQAKIITETLSFIQNRLTGKKFMLVHSDLSKTNIVYHDNKIVPIDFSLSGYCIPEMDLAMVFGNLNDETLNQHVLNGYQSVRSIKPDDKGMDSCSCLLILLFAIGQHKRRANEEWFSAKLDIWCNTKFIPLMNDADLTCGRLWKDVI